MSDTMTGAESINNISFVMSDEQRELVSMANEFARNEIRPTAERLRKGPWELPSDILAKAAELGLNNYSLPAEYGGGGLDATTSAMIMEELCWGDVGLA